MTNRKESMYDIAIIGLGPAGATLARLLSADFKIIALEKNNRGSTAFSKPCGGLLSPDAQRILSRFNLALPKDVLAGPQIFFVKAIDVKTKCIRHYQRFYININRLKFDKWLVSLIPDNVEISLDTRCIGISRTDSGFCIKAVKNNGDITINARYVVGADGANSLIRRLLYPEFKIKKYLAVQQWFGDFKDMPFYLCVFDNALTDSYAWGLSKDNIFIFGGAFELSRARENFEKLKFKMEPFGFRLSNPFKTEACLVLRPGGPHNFCTGKDGAFLIGEAAGFISPSSFEGISCAMESAYKLSGVLNGFLNKEKAGSDNQNNKNNHKRLNIYYNKATRKIRYKLFLKNLKCPFIYRPFLRKIVFKSGIKSIPVISVNGKQYSER